MLLVPVYGYPLVALGLLTGLALPAVECLHLTGSWNGLDFFKFLSRFGFQQTNLHDVAETQGYIYGNVTASDGSNATRRLVLVVVDSEYFLYYFGNRSQEQHNDACAMHQGINLQRGDRSKAGASWPSVHLLCARCQPAKVKTEFIYMLHQAIV
jgi:hypothetical protein